METLIEQLTDEAEKEFNKKFLDKQYKKQVQTSLGKIEGTATPAQSPICGERVMQS